MEYINYETEHSSVPAIYDEGSEDGFRINLDLTATGLKK